MKKTILGALTASLLFVGACTKNTAHMIPNVIPTNNVNPANSSEPDGSVPQNQDKLSSKQIAFSPQLTQQLTSQSNGAFLVSQNCVQVIDASSSTEVIRIAGRPCSPNNGSQPQMITQSEAVAEFGFRYKGSAGNSEEDYVGDILFNDTEVGTFQTQNSGSQIIIETMPESESFFTINSSGIITQWDNM